MSTEGVERRLSQSVVGFLQAAFRQRDRVLEQHPRRTLIAKMLRNQRLPHPSGSVVRIHRLRLDQALVGQFYVAVVQIQQSEICPSDRAFGGVLDGAHETVLRQLDRGVEG